MSEPERSSLEPLLSYPSSIQGNERDHDDPFATPGEGEEPDLKFGDTEAKATLERSLLRKLDRRMSMLILIYILNYMDRNNAAAARLYGFEEDLHLEGNQFASILSILYVGYIVMQVPSNMLLVYIGKPSIYLPLCMVAWGCISFITGLTTNFFGALCARFFLGFVEAAFFPGALFLISKWYKRSEISERTALLFCGALVSNAFGTLIASGILAIMGGILGYSAWRWLFFIEGFLTVVVAIWAVFVLPDFPESQSTWLTSAERALAIHRMSEDATTNPHHIRSMGLDSAGPVTKNDRTMSWAEFLSALVDWKVWWLALNIGIMCIFLSFNAFFPTLSATMGYEDNMTLLLCAPPWVVSTMITVTLSRHSDHIGERYWHVVIPFLVGISGFLLAKSTMNVVLRYLSLFLMAQAYAGYVCFLAWASGSISHEPSQRAVGLALINCGATVGNFTGSYVWPSSWGPTYSHSYSICILAAIVAISMCSVFRYHLKILNIEVEKAGSGRGYLL